LLLMFAPWRDGATRRLDHDHVTPSGTTFDRYRCCSRFLQKQMNLFWTERAGLCFQVQALQYLAGAFRHTGRTDDTKLVAPTVYFDTETLFQLMQVRIKLAAQGCQPFIVGGFQCYID